MSSVAAAGTSPWGKGNLKWHSCVGDDMSVTGVSSGRAIGRRLVAGFALVVLLSLISLVAVRPAAAAGPCGPPVTSVIACENTKPGDPPGDWVVSGQGIRRSRGSPRR